MLHCHTEMSSYSISREMMNYLITSRNRKLGVKGYVCLFHVLDGFITTPELQDFVD